MNISNKENEIEDILKEIDDVKVHYQSGHRMQRALRKQAQIYLYKEELYSIYNLVESHGPGLRLKGILRHEKNISKTFPQTMSKKYINFPCSTPIVQENIECMLKQIEEMPKEWTIVQLTPQFNPAVGFELSSDKRCTTGIHISVFNCGQKNMEPFCITVDVPRDKVNGAVVELAQEMQSITDELKQILKVPKFDGNDRGSFRNNKEKQNFISKRQSLDDRLKALVKDLQDLWLREWRCLLTAKLENGSKEQEVKAAIRNFFQTRMPNFSLNERAVEILYCTTKAANNLTTIEIKKIIEYVCPEATNKTDINNELTEFIWSHVLLANERKHPVILVLDDTLDCFPWEMIDVLKNQPVSRVYSLHFAYAIFKEHKNSIVDGYKIIKNYKNGRFIVNPDSDLKKMETRIMNFFHYWTPDWKGVVGRKPDETQFEDMLVSADIFSYNGHGNGTHHFHSLKIERIRIEAVVLLFGCESTKLSFQGPSAEMYGSSQMYTIACSPCVVGMLWIVTDMDTDLLTSVFLSEWIPSDAKTHWTSINKDKWTTSGAVEKSEMEWTEEINPREPELLRALTFARNKVRYFTNKAACVARGIPVKILLD